MRRSIRDGWPTTRFGVDPGDGRTLASYGAFLVRRGYSLGDLIESLGGPPAIVVGAFLPFAAAKKFVRALGLANNRAWHAWACSPARPSGIPSHPEVTYKESGWRGTADWLGTGRRVPVTRPLSFKKARTFARALGLHSWDEWRKWSASGKRPDNIPGGPSYTYAGKGWVGWGDWLGTGNVRKKKFLSFRAARAHVRSVGLAMRGWRVWSKTARPRDIPSVPERSYKNSGWVSYPDWLGPLWRRRVPFRVCRAVRKDFRTGLSRKSIATKHRIDVTLVTIICRGHVA
jgi:hypothetical protein